MSWSVNTVAASLPATGKDEGEEQAGAAAAGDHQGVGDAGGREDQGRGAGVASDDRQAMGRLAQELHPGTARRHGVAFTVSYQVSYTPWEFVSPGRARYHASIAASYMSNIEFSLSVL